MGMSLYEALEDSALHKATLRQGLEHEIIITVTDKPLTCLRNHIQTTFSLNGGAWIELLSERKPLTIGLVYGIGFPQLAHLTIGLQ
jgi:hypothetical protein